MASNEGDWAKQKELEKNEKYGLHTLLSIILAPFTIDPGIAHKSTSLLEHSAFLRRSNFKKDCTFLGRWIPKPETKSERLLCQKR